MASGSNRVVESTGHRGYEGTRSVWWTSSEHLLAGSSNPPKTTFPGFFLGRDVQCGHCFFSRRIYVILLLAPVQSTPRPGVTKQVLPSLPTTTAVRASI